LLGRISFPFVLLAVWIYLVVIESIDLPSSAMKFPWLIGGIGGPLLVFQIVKEARTPTEEKEESRDLGSYVVGVGWFLAIFPLIVFLGFVYGLPVYAFVALKLRGEGWLLSFLLAAFVWVFVYFGMVRALGVPIYEGWLLS